LIVLLHYFAWQSDRLQKVFEFVSTVHDLCAVLGMDFFSTVTEVHPSLNDSTGGQSKSISNDTLARLANTVLTLKEDKKQRLHKVVNYLLSIICNSCILWFCLTKNIHVYHSVHTWK
jgi:protein regulator of cytokinesis 1